MLHSQFDALEDPMDAWVVNVAQKQEKIVEYISGLLGREKKKNYSSAAGFRFLRTMVNLTGLV
ncbi:MAG: hypothetical protein ABSC61_03500 [Anaerolineales bacterium]